MVGGLGCRHLFGGLWSRLCCWLGRGWCCAGVCPPPLLGRAVFVRAPPPWWGVLCWRVRVSFRGVVAGWMPGWFCWFAVVSAAVQPALSAVGCLWCWPGRGWCSAGACSPPLLGRTVLVRGPPLCGACCFGAWPPCRSGVLCWWPPAAVVVLGLGCRWVVAAVVLLAWPGLLLCWCVPPPLLGRVVFVRAPPLGGECCVGVFGFRFVVL